VLAIVAYSRGEANPPIIIKAADNVILEKTHTSSWSPRVTGAAVKVRERYPDALRELTKRLVAIRTFDTNGRPGFEFQSYSIITSVLESAIDFDTEIPEADRPWVLRAGVSNAAKEKDLTPAALELHLKDAEREYLRTPLKDYTLASAFGIRAYRGLKTISISGVRISFALSLPRRFDRSEIADRLNQSVTDSPSDILQVFARVSARTPNAAFNQAQTEVDLIRALWNLVLNRGTRRISLFQTGTPKPVNPILPGALHTLHEAGGALIKDVFWVETHPLESSRVYDAGENWHLVQKRSLRLRSKLRSLSYRNEIEKAIVRYGRALDEADARSSTRLLSPRCRVRVRREVDAEIESLMKSTDGAG
jgi:hypothetical protein